LISLEANNAEKMSFYLKEAREMGIEILPPNINSSHIDFAVVGEKILFGLQGIKNIGLTSLNNIIAQRKKHGPFTDILNFCERIDLRTSNKRVLENLICAGAFDELAGTRAQKFHELANIIELALQTKERKETGQMQLFSLSQSNDDLSMPYVFSPAKDWSNKEKLEKEKEVLGFYLSSHPLHTYAQQLSWIQADNIADLLAIHQQKQPLGQSIEPTVTTLGLLTQKKIISTKKGDRMAFLQIEDLHNHAEIIVFPKLFKQIEEWLHDYTIFVIKGSLDLNAPNSCKIKANQCVPFELLFASWNKIHQLDLHLPESTSMEHLNLLKSLESGAIPLQVTYQEEAKCMKLMSKKQVAVSYDLLAQLQELDVTGKIIL
jgi:DNA polymerase III subunit alpha